MHSQWPLALSAFLPPEPLEQREVKAPSLGPLKLSPTAWLLPATAGGRAECWGISEVGWILVTITMITMTVKGKGEQ
jgi:hypothetical protein